eukprot:COSAG02_NODE_32054_length_523_cov_0.639151_1_plen_62_part_01
MLKPLALGKVCNLSHSGCVQSALKCAAGRAGYDSFSDVLEMLDRLRIDETGILSYKLPIERP